MSDLTGPGGWDPQVAVIILNWNGRAFLPDCLTALEQQDYRHLAVTVVDNGSSDDSVAWLRQNWPDVTVVDNGANLGFSAGNNVALRDSPAEVCALLNPDVIVSPDWLTKLVAILARDPQVGIAGSKLWYPDGQTIQHAGGFIRHPQAMPGHYAIGERDVGQSDAVRDVDYVIGGAIAVRRAVLEQVGLLDEGFFLYYEDVDYCQRARRAGWRVVYVPEATAVHIESATAVKGSFAYLQQFHTGRWRYLMKHFPVDELLDATLAAERQWLDEIALDECLAAALAYQMTLANWDEIQSARSHEGAGSVDAPQAAQLRQGLVALRDVAWSPQGPIPEPQTLRWQANISEAPFRSDVPVVGPLIAAFRTAWNNLSARWYIQPMLAQQNTFNRHLADLIARQQAEMESEFTRLSDLQSIAAMLQQETRFLARQRQEAQQVVVQLQARLEARR